MDDPRHRYVWFSATAYPPGTSRADLDYHACGNKGSIPPIREAANGASDNVSPDRHPDSGHSIDANKLHEILVQVGERAL